MVGSGRTNWCSLLGGDSCLECGILYNTTVYLTSVNMYVIHLKVKTAHMIAHFTGKPKELQGLKTRCKQPLLAAIRFDLITPQGKVQ